MEEVTATCIGKYSDIELITQIDRAASSAIDYLLETQCSNGYWCDYRLPVGISDEWVTGFVARSFYEWAPEHTALIKASEALLEQRVNGEGWGYNKFTGADADSTANVILFLKMLKRDIPVADQEFLLAHQQSDGGFSTYLDNQGWSMSHPDVTPIVFMALSDPAKRLCTASVKRYLTQHCSDNSLWASYWWRNCFYSCFHNFKLILEYFGDDLELLSGVMHQPFRISQVEPLRIDSAFDLSWLCGLYWLTCQIDQELENAKPVAIALTQELLKAQSESGFWFGSPSLRVTDPKTLALTLIQQPEGRYYTDQLHTVTTAAVLQVLALARTQLQSFRQLNSSSYKFQ